MKTLLLFIALSILHFITNAQDTKTTTITVTVTNATSNDGQLLFGLYDETTFMKSNPIQAEQSEIKNGVATITFENVPVGTYGITCVHDANSNGRMDFETNGMPKENYGVSNNNMSFGPPNWNDAKFEVTTEKLALEIRL